MRAMRLIEHLRELGMSNREAKAALSSGKVYVKDAPTADAVRTIQSAGDVRVIPNAPRRKPWVDPIIVFRDEHLAVVAKPPGLLSVPAKSQRGAPSVLGEASRLLKGALPVHRLDEGTSGLLMVARTDECQYQLKELLAEHKIERRYLAFVIGDFGAQPRRIETHLVRDRGDGLRGSGEADDATGKRAVTHLRLLRSLGPGNSVVAAELETGRTHQIRIHLAELGFPILGDRLYGDRRTASATPRLALHAEILGFQHPMTDAALRFAAPLADDLERFSRSRER